MTEASHTLTIKAVGDVCLNGIMSDPFVYVQDELVSDVLFCNLECCLTTRASAESKNVVLAADPDSVGYLSRHNFDLVCTSNNHTLDYGPEGLEDTLNALDGAEIRHFGAGLNAREAAKALLFEKNGIRFAALSTADATGGLSGGPTISVVSVRALAEAVRSVRAGADVVLVSYHGGIELDTLPSPFVMRALRGLVDAGADLVLSHHPHVLQPVEIYKGRLIAYSLGNFVFDNSRYGDKAGVAAKTTILEISLRLESVQGSRRIDTVEYKHNPVIIGDDWYPRPAVDQQRDEMARDFLVLDRSLSEIDADAADVRRMENFASEIHKKSFKTIVRYAVRHATDFSFKEIVYGVWVVARNSYRRLTGRH